MRWFFGRRAVRVVGVVALLVVVVVLLFLILNWYVAPTKPSGRKALVLAVAQILGGTALLSGLYFTWRTLQVNREGQITERFTRAIDQLGKLEDGNKLFEIRVGGIYALERIARESEEDYWPIMEILTAYVRRNAPRSPSGNHEGTDDATKAQSAMERCDSPPEATEPPTPEPDIQAIMTVLRRRTRYYGHGELERLDLSTTNLSRTYLPKANLVEAGFYKADLSRANLSGADLSGANLSGANLARANLFGANLARANLWGANLSRAYLSGADLSRTELREAFLQEANLSEANLSEQNLSRTHLSRADLSGANLSRANLSGADLSGADLFRADLSGADLSGADLFVAEVTQEQLDEAKGDEYTKLSSYLKPPAHWGVKTDEQTEGS